MTLLALEYTSGGNCIFLLTQINKRPSTCNTKTWTEWPFDTSVPCSSSSSATSDQSASGRTPSATSSRQSGKHGWLFRAVRMQAEYLSSIPLHPLHLLGCPPLCLCWVNRDVWVFFLTRLWRLEQALLCTLHQDHLGD